MPCGGIEETPISSTRSLATLSALDSSFPGPVSPPLGRRKCNFLLFLSPGFGLGLSVASGEVSGGCADLSRYPLPHKSLNSGAATRVYMPCSSLAEAAEVALAWTTRSGCLPCPASSPSAWAWALLPPQLPLLYPAASITAAAWPLQEPAQTSA